MRKLSNESVSRLLIVADQCSTLLQIAYSCGLFLHDKYGIIDNIMIYLINIYVADCHCGASQPFLNADIHANTLTHSPVLFLATCSFLTKNKELLSRRDGFGYGFGDGLGDDKIIPQLSRQASIAKGDYYISACSR